MQDGFYKTLPVFAETVGAIDVFTKSCDDVVVIDSSLDVGGRVFGDEFFIRDSTEVTLEAVSFKFGVDEFKILVSNKGKPGPIGRL